MDDNFLFIALLRSWCNEQVSIFKEVCGEVGMPISAKKTFWATAKLTFLGFLLDGENHLVLIPIEKLEKGNELIDELLNPRKKKVTLRHLQQLCGFFNFLCRCVVPGGAFTRQMYAPIKNKLKPHHHLRITNELHMDLRMWKEFLAYPGVFSHSFSDFSVEKKATEIDLYTDAAGKATLGGAGVNNREWFFVGWDPTFIAKYKPSIEYLELYAVTVAVVLWLYKFANMKICLFCDNQAVVSMINSMTSSCKHCMILIWVIVLHSLKHNTVVKAKYVKSQDNSRADALSRKKFELFHSLTNYTANAEPCPIPCELHPMAKLWLN